MSERDTLKESVGNYIKVFLTNGFKYEGKLLDSDENFIKILDAKTNQPRFISKEQIIELSLEEKDGH